jgi:hypothetical protein
MSGGNNMTGHGLVLRDNGKMNILVTDRQVPRHLANKFVNEVSD